VRTLSLIAVIAVPAFAQTIYTWEDKDGVHATDDLSQVPKARKVEAMVPEARPASTGLVAPKPAPVAAAPTGQSSEYEWRDLFIAAHRRIDTLRRSIAALEASLPPRVECVPQPVRVVGVGFVPTPATGARQLNAYCQVNPIHDQLRVEIAQQGVDLRNAELDLDQLDRRASLMAVPREWRRGW
jgi:hypothetical protein